MITGTMMSSISRVEMMKKLRLLLGNGTRRAQHDHFCNRSAGRRSKERPREAASEHAETKPRDLVHLGDYKRPADPPLRKRKTSYSLMNTPYPMRTSQDYFNGAFPCATSMIMRTAR